MGEVILTEDEYKDAITMVFLDYLDKKYLKLKF